jgi:cyclopropane fatty-acyl-phospholipid synthase-like methyltransferase
MTATEVTAGSKGPVVKLLLSMCRSPEAADFPTANVDYEQAAALDPLREVFPNIDREIAGRRVIDFGCGKGYQAVGYALAGAESVVGVEIAEELLKQSKARVEQNGLAGKVRIERELTSDIKGDIIVSQNSFEHFIEPEATLQLLKASLAPGGKIYVTFGLHGMRRRERIWDFSARCHGFKWCFRRRRSWKRRACSELMTGEAIKRPGWHRCRSRSLNEW